MWTHARIQKALPEGVVLWQVFFLVDEGRKDPYTTISGQSSARPRFASVPMLAHY